MTFLTQYPSGHHHYRSYVIAPDLRSAELLLYRRGMGERITGTGKVKRHSASKLYRAGRYLECAHLVCFLGTAICHTRMWPVSALIGDSGILHQLIHEAMREDDRYIVVDEDRRMLKTMLGIFDERARKLGF